ncbi:MAG: DUF559 domain-containing protein [Armatimonadetes bacterium]|nr:DUF559 domain-containing protein [Armatimonadota bacterium]
MEGKTRPRVRGASRELQQIAREMRREMTPAERVLWEALHGKQLVGLRFRPQHPVGQFALDFYCPAAKLVIEVDGDIHDLRQEEDAVRTKHLEAYGCHVIRFRNEEIMHSLPAVLDAIRKAASARVKAKPPSGSPRIGG